MRKPAGSPDGMGINTKKGDRCISLRLSPGASMSLEEDTSTPGPPRDAGFFLHSRSRRTLAHVGRHPSVQPAPAAFAVVNNSTQSHNARTTTTNPAGLGGAAPAALGPDPREWVGRANGGFAACGYFSEIELLVLLFVLLRGTGATWLIQLGK